MKTENYQNEILQAVKMDGCINFHANGDINLYPCPWESDKEATPGGKVRYRGGIVVDADGHTLVKRYYDGKRGPKYETLYETPHGKVQMSHPQIYPSDGGRRISRESVYITFKFPKKYGVALMKSLFREETDEIMSYLKTRKEETVWK